MESLANILSVYVALEIYRLYACSEYTVDVQMFENRDNKARTDGCVYVHPLFFNIKDEWKSM